MQRARFIATGTAATALGVLPRTAHAKPIVKVGFIDSFSGSLADLGGRHDVGVRLAIDEANKRGRVQYVLVKGDDNSKPATATTELRRLIEQEKIDVLLQGSSSASALAMMPVAEEAGLFLCCIGPNDTSICGKRASKNTYRFAPNVQMLTRALAQPILAGGKKWYFIVSDFAFGNDAYTRLATLLRQAGGTEIGADKMPLGTNDFSSVLTKIRNLDANQVVMCLAGFDTAACAKQFVSFGLHKTMKISGIFLEDAYASALPLDELRGSVFGLTWSPYVTPSSEMLAKKIKAVNNGSVSFRNYMGYITAQQLTDRIEAAGTTRAETLVGAFANHHFNVDKATEAVWRGCDHQCVQDTYAGAIVSTDRYKKTGYLFDVVADVRGNQVAGTCGDVDAAAAQAIIASQTIPLAAR